MTNIAMAGSPGMAGLGVADKACGFIRNWRARRGLARLEACEDFILRDIGLTRDDIRWAASLPLRVGAMAALQSRTSAPRTGSA